MADIFDIFKSIEKERVQMPIGAPEYIIAFLGNPGKEYIHTRHNAGFMCSDYLAEKNNINIDRLKFRALTCEAMFGGKKVLFLKPQTYMNLSGESVKEAISFYKINPETNLIVVYDDIYMDIGKLRIREKGSDGGHNGIKNIIYQLGTDTFKRVRIGVGKPIKGYNLPDWVLGVIPQNDRADFFKSLENAYNVLELMVKGQTSVAMNKYNG